MSERDRDLLVWSDELGDCRKSGKAQSDEPVQEHQLCLHIRRLTSGKGRVVIEISNLPENKIWCQKLAKQLKKKLAVGGSYKNGLIQVHGEVLEKVKKQLENLQLKYKKIGG